MFVLWASRINVSGALYPCAEVSHIIIRGTLVLLGVNTLVKMSLGSDQKLRIRRRVIDHLQTSSCPSYYPGTILCIDH